MGIHLRIMIKVLMLFIFMVANIFMGVGAIKRARTRMGVLEGEALASLSTDGSSVLSEDSSVSKKSVSQSAERDVVLVLRPPKFSNTCTWARGGRRPRLPSTRSRTGQSQKAFMLCDLLLPAPAYWGQG